MELTLFKLTRNETGEIRFRNAKWHPHGVINCEVQFVETGDEWFGFTASPDDTVVHGRELFHQLSTTYESEVEPCTEDEKRELAISELNSQREVALRDSDWLCVVDVHLENQEDWLDYRQAWRDLSLQKGYPFDVEIPTAPPITANKFNLSNYKKLLNQGDTK